MANEIAAETKKEVRSWTPNEPTSVPFLKGLLSKDDVKKRFMEVLGDNAGAFMSSIVTLTASSTPALQKCDPATIVSAAFSAAACKLSLSSSLGHAYIVPYKDVAQFQIGWKGLVQLALRSGQVKRIHVTEVYKDEIELIDHVHGIYEFKHVESGMREKGDSSNISGYFAVFTLTNGFTKELYMSQEQMQAHAKKYSQSYRTDLSKGWNMSTWSKDSLGMSLKTVCKLLLVRWCPLSIEMQRAIEADQAVDGDYVDNQEQGPSGEEPVIPASVAKATRQVVDAQASESSVKQDITTEELAERSKKKIAEMRAALPEEDKDGF